MTPNEFKAWFDGFTEAFAGCPTKVQWTRIKARVAEIDGKRVTETVYIDRYVRPYPYWQYLGHGVCSGSTGNAIGSNKTESYSWSAAGKIGSGGASFNSLQAMTDLGRVEAQSISV